MNRIFVILFMARSGSKYFSSMLNRHDDVNCYGEAFHDPANAFRGDENTTGKLLEIALDPIARPGFEFRYPRHFREAPEIGNAIVSNARSIDFICLRRRNKIAGAVSQQNAEKLKSETGKAHLFSSTPKVVEPLVLDVERAISEALQREQLDRKYELFASAYRYHIVEYEDLLIDPYAEVARTTDFLGLMKPNHEVVFSDLVKVTSPNLEESLANFNDLERKLAAIGRLDLADLGEREASKGSVGRPTYAFHRRLERKHSSDPIAVLEGSTKDNLHVKVAISRPKMKTHVRFLEHVAQDGIQEVLVVDRNEILVSADVGKSWSRQQLAFEPFVCFTLADGIRLCQERWDGRVHRIDGNGTHLGTSHCGAFPWHGTQGIDQNPRTGTVIWGEYGPTSDRMRLWRSSDGGKTWAVALDLPGDRSQDTDAVRHFHLVQHCTTKNGRWFAATGDTASQTQQWSSVDDGASWQRAGPLAYVDNERIPAALAPKLSRYTGLVQTDDMIIYPTDDTFGGRGSVLCRVRKDDLSDLSITPGWISSNECRSITAIDDRFSVVTTESKLDPRGAEVAAYDAKYDDIIPLGSLENANNVKSNFTNSVASRRAVKGVFFTASDNQIIRPSGKTLRWSWTIAQN